MRWEHPEFGMISPGDFVPVFERNGFIYHLDLFVWGKACWMLREWKEMGAAALPISVNVSRIDLYHEDLLESLLGMVRENGLDPGELPIDTLKLDLNFLRQAEHRPRRQKVMRLIIDPARELRFQVVAEGSRRRCRQRQRHIALNESGKPMPEYGNGFPLSVNLLPRFSGQSPIRVFFSNLPQAWKWE